MVRADSSCAVAALIEDLVLRLVRDLTEGRIDGAVVMISRVPANRAFALSGAIIPGWRTSARRFSPRSTPALVRMLAVIAACHGLLRRGEKVSQRQLFYMLIHTFPNQHVLNDIVLDVSAALAVPRYALNIGAATRGVVAGVVSISTPESRFRIDCEFVGINGWPIPGRIDVVNALQMTSNARYVLVIEKFGIFQRLCEDGFYKHLPSILVCGKGQPSVATRLFVMRLEQTFSLPILGLVDLNPHGLAILHAYRQGSIRTSIEGSTFVSNVRWLGLRASQLRRLDAEYSIGVCGEPLTSRDVSILNTLRESVQRTHLGHEYMEEIEAMKTVGKHELQWLYGHPDGLSFLSQTFLPMAILRRDFI